MCLMWHGSLTYLLIVTPCEDMSWLYEVPHVTRQPNILPDCNTRVKKMHEPVSLVRGTQSNYFRNHIEFAVFNLAFLVF